MVTPFAVRHGAAFRSLTVATVGAALSALTCSLPAQGETPGDTVKRMQALYNNASSYKGTMKQSQSGKNQQGQPFSVSQKQVVTFSKPNKLHVQADMTATGAAAKANGTSNTIVSDGKTVYEYLPKKQLYAKQPAPPKMKPLVGTSQFALIDFDIANAKQISSVTVNGRRAVVIEVTPDISKVPADKRAEALKSVKPIDLTIDATSYALLRISPPKLPPLVELSDQVFNAPVPGSTFAFTPPAGAKLYTPPPPTGGPAQGGVAPGGAR